MKRTHLGSRATRAPFWDRGLCARTTSALGMADVDHRGRPAREACACPGLLSGVHGGDEDPPTNGVTMRWLPDNAQCSSCDIVGAAGAGHRVDHRVGYRRRQP
jgi:hypothetical protein